MIDHVCSLLTGSLANSPERLFRPEDKGLKMFYPAAADEGNSFDDFFNEEMYRPDASDEENKAQLDDFTDLFNDAFNQDEYKLPSLDTSANKTEQSPPQQPWRQGVWSLMQRRPLKMTM